MLFLLLEMILIQTSESGRDNKKKEVGIPMLSLTSQNRPHVPRFLSIFGVFFINPITIK